MFSQTMSTTHVPLRYRHTVLAFDLSKTDTGYAVLRVDVEGSGQPARVKICEVGTFPFKDQKFSNNYYAGADNFDRNFNELLQDHPDLQGCSPVVVYEAPAYGARFGTEGQYLLHTTLIENLKRHGLQGVGVSPSMVKPFLRDLVRNLVPAPEHPDRMNAPTKWTKAGMKAAAARLSAHWPVWFPIQFKNDNALDAFLIAWYGMAITLDAVISPPSVMAHHPLVAPKEKPAPANVYPDVIREMGPLKVQGNPRNPDPFAYAYLHALEKHTPIPHRLVRAGLESLAMPRGLLDVLDQSRAKLIGHCDEKVYKNARKDPPIHAPVPMTVGHGHFHPYADLLALPSAIRQNCTNWDEESLQVRFQTDLTFDQMSFLDMQGLESVAYELFMTRYGRIVPMCMADFDRKPLYWDEDPGSI